MEHTAAVAVPAYPLAHVQPVTEKVLVARLVSVLPALLYPDVEVGAMHFDCVDEHTTPPLLEGAAAQKIPPYGAVHGLSEQVGILEPESEMSIVVFEFIMMTEPVLE